MRLQLFLISASLAFIPSASHALVKVSADDPSELAVLGEISPFDAITFEGMANSQEQHGHPIRFVKLDSPGGDIGLAMKIAENIERRGLATRVAPGGLCASACVLPLAAGKHVRIGAGAQVGVHQAHAADGGEAWGGTYSMAAFLASHHVAHAVTIKLLDTPRDGKAYLTQAEMRASGWTVDDGPQEAIAPSSLVATIPGAIAPPPSASSPDAYVRPTSAEVVEVPHHATSAPTVIPAPTEAAPVPAAPAAFRPLPAPASLPRTAQRGKCSTLLMAGILPVGAFEGGCLIERATDASLRITLDQPDAKPVYFYPNGPASMLASSDGVSFMLDKPLTISADRTCMKTAGAGFEICATSERPATILDGLDGLFAGLFGAAVETERRLGLLGQ